MKKFIILIIGLCLVTNVSANEKEEVKLNKCVDGDTAVFIIKDEEVRVRFLAIDTPETVHPTKSIEKYGKNASEYTCNKLTKAKKIELEYDSGSTKIDKYGRTLAWVWVDGSMLQKELIEVGYATVKYIYGKYAYTNDLYQVEDIAKENKLGLWASYEPTTFIVTFDNDGETIEVKVNENERVEKIEVSKEGYIFDGWFLGNKLYDFDSKVTKDITLKASYSKNISYYEILFIIIVLILIYIISPKKIKTKLEKSLKKEIKKQVKK